MSIVQRSVSQCGLTWPEVIGGPCRGTDEAEQGQSTVPRMVGEAEGVAVAVAVVNRR